MNADAMPRSVEATNNPPADASDFTEMGIPVGHSKRQATSSELGGSGAVTERDVGLCWNGELNISATRCYTVG